MPNNKRAQKPGVDSVLSKAREGIWHRRVETSALWAKHQEEQHVQASEAGSGGHIGGRSGAEASGAVSLPSRQAKEGPAAPDARAAAGSAPGTSQEAQTHLREETHMESEDWGVAGDDVGEEEDEAGEEGVTSGLLSVGHRWAAKLMDKAGSRGPKLAARKQHPQQAAAGSKRAASLDAASPYAAAAPSARSAAQVGPASGAGSGGMAAMRESSASLRGSASLSLSASLAASGGLSASFRSGAAPLSVRVPEHGPAPMSPEQPPSHSHSHGQVFAHAHRTIRLHAPVVPPLTPTFATGTSPPTTTPPFSPAALKAGARLPQSLPASPFQGGTAAASNGFCGAVAGSPPRGSQLYALAVASASSGGRTSPGMLSPEASQIMLSASSRHASSALQLSPPRSPTALPPLHSRHSLEGPHHRLSVAGSEQPGRSPRGSLGGRTGLTPVARDSHTALGAANTSTGGMMGSEGGRGSFQGMENLLALGGSSSRSRDPSSSALPGCGLAGAGSAGNAWPQQAGASQQQPHPPAAAALQAACVGAHSQRLAQHMAAIRGQVEQGGGAPAVRAPSPPPAIVAACKANTWEVGPRAAAAIQLAAQQQQQQSQQQPLQTAVPAPAVTPMLQPMATSKAAPAAAAAAAAGLWAADSPDVTPPAATPAPCPSNGAPAATAAAAAARVLLQDPFAGAAPLAAPPVRVTAPAGTEALSQLPPAARSPLGLGQTPPFSNPPLSAPAAALITGAAADVHAVSPRASGKLASANSGLAKMLGALKGALGSVGSSMKLPGRASLDAARSALATQQQGQGQAGHQPHRHKHAHLLPRHSEEVSSPSKHVFSLHAPSASTLQSMLPWRKPRLAPAASMPQPSAPAGSRMDGVLGANMSLAATTSEARSRAASAALLQAAPAAATAGTFAGHLAGTPPESDPRDSPAAAATASSDSDQQARRGPIAPQATHQLPGQHAPRHDSPRELFVRAANQLGEWILSESTSSGDWGRGEDHRDHGHGHAHHNNGGSSNDDSGTPTGAHATPSQFYEQAEAAYQQGWRSVHQLEHQHHHRHNQGRGDGSSGEEEEEEEREADVAYPEPTLEMGLDLREPEVAAADQPHISTATGTTGSARSLEKCHQLLQEDGGDTEAGSEYADDLLEWMVGVGSRPGSRTMQAVRSGGLEASPARYTDRSSTPAAGPHRLASHSGPRSTVASANGAQDSPGRYGPGRQDKGIGSVRLAGSASAGPGSGRAAGSERTEGQGGHHHAHADSDTLGSWRAPAPSACSKEAGGVGSRADGEAAAGSQDADSSSHDPSPPAAMTNASNSQSSSESFRGSGSNPAGASCPELAQKAHMHGAMQAHTSSTESPCLRQFVLRNGAQDSSNGDGHGCAGSSTGSGSSMKGRKILKVPHASLNASTLKGAAAAQHAPTTRLARSPIPDPSSSNARVVQWLAVGGAAPSPPLPTSLKQHLVSSLKVGLGGIAAPMSPDLCGSSWPAGYGPGMGHAHCVHAARFQGDRGEAEGAGVGAGAGVGSGGPARSWEPHRILGRGCHEHPGLQEPPPVLHVKQHRHKCGVEDVLVRKALLIQQQQQ